jgi:hypothetical protein
MLGAHGRPIWRICGLGALAMAMCADGDAVPFAGSVSRSSYFEYHDRDPEPLCGTLLGSLDAHARLIGEKLSVGSPPADPYRYFKFHDLNDFAANSGGCAPESGACAYGTSVYASTFFNAHEQAHAYVARAWGGPSTGLVNEGEAVALSCLPSYGAQPTDAPRDVLGNRDWRDLLYLRGVSIEGYLEAGFWITYLAKRYGWARVAELHRRVPPAISSEDFAREFASVFPLSMDRAWSEALGDATEAPCEDDWRCIARPLSIGDVINPDCDGELHRSVTIDGQAGVVLTMTGVDSEIVLRSCAQSAAPQYELLGGGTSRTTHWASLPPGTYTMFPAPAPSEVRLRSYVPSGAVSEDCTSAAVVALDPGETLYFDLLAGETNGWLRLDGGGRAYAVALNNIRWSGWPLDDGAPELCDACDSSTCAPLGASGATPAVVGAHAALHLRHAVAKPPSSTMWSQIVFMPAQTAGGTP